MSLSARVRAIDRTLRALLLVTGAGLLARLVLLGWRVQHFDEARVGWWTLEFMRTGSFEYRYIIHGPFIQHVNTLVFSLLGPSDFSSRLVVALVGGLLPLSVYLLRDHLRREEQVAAAVFLAFNPVLLYYSRFFRSTVLVAAFMFVAFGFLVRFLDTRRPRFVHLTALFAALGFTAKENAVIYVVCWLGAGVLVLALDAYARPGGRTGVDRLRAAVDRLERPTERELVLGVGHLALAVVLFLGVVVFFFAPRGGPNGLYRALSAPAKLPTTLGSMVDAIEVGYRYWFGHTSEPGCHQDNLVDAYACFLGRSLEVLAGYAAPLVGLALVGTVAEYVAARRPRALVIATAAWGFVSVLGYPLGTDVFGAWIMVNALVPLAVPAGVGLGLVYRHGLAAHRDDDRVGVAVAALVLVVVAGQLAVVGATSSYLEPAADDNDLVQYAQPSQDWRGTLRDVDRAARDNDGPDVLLYGDAFVDGDVDAERRPACARWFKVLPLPWYTERADVEVTCSTRAADLGNLTRMPPVVVAPAAERETVASRLGPAYEERTHYLRTVGVETVVFIRQ